MADPFAATAEPETPAAPPPAPSITPEIEALIAQRVQELSDKRVAGLQSTYDKKLTEINKELQRVRTQALGEPEEPLETEYAKRIAELERQNALLLARQQHPEGVDLYEQMMSFETAEEQIAFLSELKRTASQPPQNPAPRPPAQEVDVPDVDPNRPAPAGPGSISNSDGILMTDQMAKDILSSVTSWPTIR